MLIDGVWALNSNTEWERLRLQLSKVNIQDLELGNVKLQGIKVWESKSNYLSEQEKTNKWERTMNYRGNTETLAAWGWWQLFETEKGKKWWTAQIQTTPQDTWEKWKVLSCNSRSNIELNVAVTHVGENKAFKHFFFEKTWQHIFGSSKTFGSVWIWMQCFCFCFF